MIASCYVQWKQTDDIFLFGHHLKSPRYSFSFAYELVEMESKRRQFTNGQEIELVGNAR